MIAVDTNVLIYAHRAETGLHGPTVSQLVALAEGIERWALPVFCITGFMRVVALRNVFKPPSTVEQAARFIEGIAASPLCEILRPGSEFPGCLLSTDSPQG